MLYFCGKFKSGLFMNDKLFEVFVSRFRAEIEPEKLYFYKYGRLFNVMDFIIEIDLKESFDFLKKEYNLTEENILHKYEVIETDSDKDKLPKDDVIYMINQENSKYILDLPDKQIIISLEEDEVKVIYADLTLEDEIKELINSLPKKKNETFESKFFMVYASKFDDLRLKPFDVKDVEVNVEEFYNDDFVEVDKAIKEFLNDDKRDGIILLHGTYGTGKTTYLRHLMKTVNKRFIFFPQHLAHRISSPELLDFVSKLRNSVLVMEDCEDILKPRGSGNAANEALVNLLNLGDGLLADALSLKIICTFNARVDKIDPAILRKGRLAVQYEFHPLKKEKAERLVKKYNLPVEVKGDMTLAEIFIKDQVVKRKQKANLGFKAN